MIVEGGRTGGHEFFSDVGITRLRSWPDELGRDELIGFFTLDIDDRAWLEMAARGAGNRLGLAVQLCALPWLGFVPDDVAAVPKAATSRVAVQLGVPMADLTEYGARAQTRTTHLQAAAARGPVPLMERIATVRAAAVGELFGRVEHLAPHVTGVLSFDASTEAKPLLAAVEVLRELYARGGRKVPDGTPSAFVPTRWRRYLEHAAKTGDTAAYRHYWELCTLLALRDGLRSGDVWVPGSRRYADPTTFLLPPPRWRGLRAEYCALVEVSPSADDAPGQVEEQLRAALSELEPLLAQGTRADPDER